MLQTGLGGFFVYRIDELGQASRVREVPRSTRSRRARWVMLILLAVWFGSGILIGRGHWGEEEVPVNPVIGAALVAVFFAMLVAAEAEALTRAESLSSWVYSRDREGEEWFELRADEEW